MTSSAISVNSVLADYVAGRVPAAELARAVATAYYGNRGAGSEEWLRPVMDVIERAHPGIVELTASSDKPGFAVRLAERPFPKQWEPALRDAAARVGGTASHPSPLPPPSLFTRLVRAIKKIFSA
jgi:hypothetical protein